MSYVIFSIDNWWDLHTLAKFTRHVDTLRSMGKLQGNVVSLVGCYEDVLETSFLVTERDFEDHVLTSDYVKGQHSFMYVSEQKQMPARIVTQDGEILQRGRLKQVSVINALDQSGWTYRPDVNTYYILEASKDG